MPTIEFLALTCTVHVHDANTPNNNNYSIAMAPIHNEKVHKIQF